MSSILDALNKLEDDKVQVEADPDDIEVNMDDARHDLVGRSVMDDHIELRMKPATMIAVAAGFAVLLVAVSVIVSLALSGDDAKTSAASTQVAKNEVAPIATSIAAEPPIVVDSAKSAGPISEAIKSGAETEPAPVPPSNPQVVNIDSPSTKPDVAAAWPTEPEPRQIAPAPKSQTARSVQPPVVQAPPPQVVVVESTPEPEPVAATPTQIAPRVISEPPVTTVAELAPPVMETRAPSVVPASTESANSLAAKPDAVRTPVMPYERHNVRSVAAAPVDRAPVETNVESTPESTGPRRVEANQLPILSQSARARHDLGDMIVNIVSPATEIKPTASAVINRMKLFEGERITGTTAKLVQVESNGVVIEITGTGERYFLPH